MLGSEDILAAFNQVRRRYNISYPALKTEQLKALGGLMNGRHTFCVLPTGFGKSEIFILPPLLYDEVILK